MFAIPELAVSPIMQLRKACAGSQNSALGATVGTKSTFPLAH
jgi:hypothetical protein